MVYEEPSNVVFQFAAAAGTYRATSGTDIVNEVPPIHRTSHRWSNDRTHAQESEQVGLACLYGLSLG